MLVDVIKTLLKKLAVSNNLSELDRANHAQEDLDLAPKRTKKRRARLAGIVFFASLAALFRLLGRFFGQKAMYPPQIAHSG